MKNLEIENRQKLTDLLKNLPESLIGEVILERYFREGVATFFKASRITESLLEDGSRCEETLIWLLGGRASTDNKGESIIDLNKYLCLRHDETSRDFYPSITNKPYFVAISRSSVPVLLTTTYTLDSTSPPAQVTGDTPGNLAPTVFRVQIKVLSWKLDGTSAPNIGFDWNCIVEGARWFVLGG
jgi:hypothetical protein